MTTENSIVFLGAAGQMCDILIQRLAKATSAPFLLADIHTAPLVKLQQLLAPGKATVQKLDLFDASTLLSTVQGARLVILAAGPYVKTSRPVMDACLQAKVPYLDFDDDVESTLAALDRSDEAKSAGIPVYIGCGASPGMSNVMAVDVARQLDQVYDLDLCWLVGNGTAGAGKAVLEHLMHIAAGPCLTTINGKPVLRETYVDKTYAPMLGDTEMLLHETAHPEPVTLPRLFPNANRIQCYGGLYPPPKWGFARGLATAVRRGALSMTEAVDFQFNARLGKLPATIWAQMLRDYTQRVPNVEIDDPDVLKQMSDAGKARGPWNYALEGMIEQVESGELTRDEVAAYFLSIIRHEAEETLGSLLVRGVGVRNGHPAVVTKRTPTVPVDCFLLRSMATMTGTACAAFALLVLQGHGKEAGVFSPEDWADPGKFYKALAELGTPVEEMVEYHVY